MGAVLYRYWYQLCCLLALLVHTVILQFQHAKLQQPAIQHKHSAALAMQSATGMYMQFLVDIEALNAAADSDACWRQ